MCLCSIPKPEEIVGTLYSYLKSGGALLVFEHVRSEYRVMSALQTLYTKAFWRYVMCGCELNRPTRQYLLDGEAHERKQWKQLELIEVPGQGCWSLIPMMIGKLVKG